MQAKEAEWKNADEGIREAFEDGTINKREFDEEQNMIQRHRFVIIREEMTLGLNEAKFSRNLDCQQGVNWPAAYMELLANAFRVDRENKVHPEDMRDDDVHKAWKKYMVAYYRAANPEAPEQRWCPVSKRFISPNSIKAAHIFQHFMGYENIAQTFGEHADEGFSLMWSPQNGMFLYHAIEGAMDKAQCTFVGQQSPGRPTEYTFVVLDDRILDDEAGWPSTTFRQLNNTKLDFKNDKRPGEKYMYWHFASSLMRNLKMQTPGITDKIRNLVTGNAWVNADGDWYDGSMLKAMGEYLG